MRDLETLNAIEDIRALEARYARYADEKRWGDLAGLFAVDGWFRPQDAEGNVIADMQGRAAIAAELGERNSGDDVQPLHQLLTHEIDIVSPTEAKAVWAMSDLIFRTAPENADTAPAGGIPPFRVMRGWGHYHVTYRRIDGQWRIATRLQTRTRLEFEL